MSPVASRKWPMCSSLYKGPPSETTFCNKLYEHASVPLHPTHMQLVCSVYSRHARYHVTVLYRPWSQTVTGRLN